MNDPIPITVVHYSRKNPEKHYGGVEAFASTLKLIFAEVLFMTPGNQNIELVRQRQLPVICDNHMVLDWPDDIPVIGFQHGLAAKKFMVTRSLTDAGPAYLQWRAASRGNTLWVACANWVSDAFGKLHSNPARHIIYYPVDLERFDGKTKNPGSRLVLHDGRFIHKGRRLFRQLSLEIPDWNFEPLDCKPEEVPERMRKARAFLHLSRYEGYGIVCNEAMAMNLPCMFTRVGLMLDCPDCDVEVVPVRKVFSGGRQLTTRVNAFLDSLDKRRFQPRDWVIANASIQEGRRRWTAVMDEFNA